jgi:hypothetical protein
MTAFLEPREGVLIARAGEEIVCPECGETLAVYEADHLYGDERRSVPTEVAVVRWFGKVRRLRCCCGGQPHRSGNERDPRRHGKPRSMKECAVPQTFIRSGSWVGWRGLGE